MSPAKDKCFVYVMWQFSWNPWKPELLPLKSRRKLVDFHTLSWEAPWQCWVQFFSFSSWDVWEHILTQTPSAFLINGSLSWSSCSVGISHLWINDLLSCNHVKRVFKIIKWVTWHLFLFSLSVHWRYIKPNESHFALYLTICYFKLGCLFSLLFPFLGSRGWPQFLGFARELPCRLRPINSLVPIHPVPWNRPTSLETEFKYNKASFIWAMSEFTRTRQITETYPFKSQTCFLKILIILSRHFSKTHYTLSFLLKQRLLITISWSGNLCLHLLSGCSDSSFGDKDWLLVLLLSWYSSLIASLFVFSAGLFLYVLLLALGSYQTCFLTWRNIGEESVRPSTMPRRVRLRAQQRQSLVMAVWGSQRFFGLLY